MNRVSWLVLFVAACGGSNVSGGIPDLAQPSAVSGPRFDLAVAETVDAALAMSVDLSTVSTAYDASIPPIASGCIDGASCAMGQPCGTWNGTQAQACDCGSDGKLHCGTAAFAPPCPADQMTASQQLSAACANGVAMGQVVCVDANASGCSMSACYDPQVNGFSGGWHGVCSASTSCPGSAICGNPCVPGATGCTCIEDVLTMKQVPCGCVASGATGYWAC